jgi:Ser/Thr protein kinase RdoA (MazF antagonist)
MLLREGGNATYAVYTDQKKFFLKIVGSAFSDTFNMSVDINLYLLENGFSVPNIIMTADNKPFIEDEKKYIILYEFLETTEIDMEKDAEAVGLLIGQLHHLMSGYKGELIMHDKQFYVERYIDILIKKQYPKFDEFKQYSEMLWNRIKSLPRGYSHGDMYCGNIARGSDGKLYVLDFDTSCIGFPLYDLTLICNQTDYFDYDTEGLSKTTAIYKRLLPEYLKNYKLADRKINSLNNMIALYHFALQATIIEIYGLDCVDNAFFDKQLDWLKQWEIQCKSVG